LKLIVNELTGIDLADIDPQATFFEMGVDSLLLIQANQAIKEKLGVEISLVQLFEELSSIEALVVYLDESLPQLPDEAPADESLKDVSPPELSPPAPGANFETDTTPLDFRGADSEAMLEDEALIDVEVRRGGAGEVRKIIAQQLQIMSRQLEVLRGAQTGAGRIETRAQTETIADTQASQGLMKIPAPALEDAGRKSGAASPSLKVKSSAVNAASPAVQTAETHSKLGLTPHQEKRLKALIERYNARTRESKRSVQAYRPYWADNRASAGFRLLWKEMVYPLIVNRSAGSKVWDVDGNQYLDMAMGFGVNLFGHSPSFITEALARQLDRGIQLGPQSDQAGGVAKLICELTGVERATFCNSGTEAVMVAIRLARTRTRRTRIALFAGSYHGTFDETLVRGVNINGASRTVPAAPGVAPHMTEDVLVLEYDNPQSLDIIRAHAGELAAVLVEPVQSRRPDVQPRAFLHQLRGLTEEAGIALIFDEVITGFRVHPGGSQQWFSVQADIVTYGKVVGGGMPIGVVAGKAAYIDAIDGGFWEYGDNSYPRAEKTIFAGTFCKHPLAMAAAHAVLAEMQARGPALQENLNARTTQLAQTLNSYFEREGVPVNVLHFGSLFQYAFQRGVKFAELFPFYLVEQGVYVWEGPTRFLSTAHTDEDLDFLVRATKRAVTEMQEAEFLPSVAKAAPKDETHAPRLAEGTGACVEERGAGSEFPLTEAQHQLWVLSQMGDDASCAFNESITLHMRGTLNEEALRAALHELVQRHEALRTSFTSGGESQRIQSDVKLDVPFVDFSALDKDERRSRLAERIAAEAETPFDLSRCPLMRASIVKLEEQLHLLVLTIHHIVIDGQSYGVLLEELRDIYAALCQGRAFQLPPPTSFRAYVEWHVKRQEESSEAATAYWARQFEDAVPLVELPTLGPRPPVRTYAGSRETLFVNELVGKKLQHLSARYGSTTFMTLLAAYNLLLHRLTGQDDVVVGVPAAGQAAMGSKSLVGFGVVQLPLRSIISAELTFAEYLRAVRKRVLEGQGHKEYSLGQLIKKLNLAPDPSRVPLMNVSFNLERAGVARFYGMEVEVETNSTAATKFDLYLNVTETAGALRLDCDYNTDLFDGETIRRWLNHYRTLLEGIVVRPEERVSALPLLSEDERRRMLVEWNETEAEYPKDACLQELFEAQVERTPDAVAVEFEGRRLTYRELNRRANQLAHHLRSLGVGAEVLVGLCVEHSLEMMTGLLGVLKAGGAYVPLDPAYPVERLGFMLEDAGAPVLLTQKGLRDALPPYAGRVVELDSAWELISQSSEENPHSVTSAENLAYVIYTSGSTGRPKGSLIHHRGLVNYLCWCVKAYGVEAGQGSLVHSSLSFDLTVTSLYAPLLAGRKVEILGTANHLEALTDALRQPVDLSLLKLTPAHLKLLASELSGKEAAGRTRALIVGGENLLADVTAFWREAAPQTSIVNEYGPTETVVGCCVYEVTAETPRRGSIPIGRPIANTQLYILDRNLEPVPPGVVGQLYISGAGLARGYLNRPELTPEKFIPNPFDVRAGARRYRTGDLARYLPGGNIEYLGRLDHQVKVRGFRIELEEIEVALASHPSVREAVVVLREDEAGENRLVAYVTAAARQASEDETGEEQALSVSDLRKFVKRRLPSYMIPSSFVVLDQLPLTHNGKVDKHALPAPDASRPELDEEFVAPSTPAEELMANIWAEALGVERVGIQDNFFDLGGDSIINIQIASKATQAGLRITPRQVFQHQTIAELVAALGTDETVHAEQGVITGDAPLTPVQRWFFEQELTDAHHFNQAVLLEVREAVNVERLRKAAGHLLLHHDALRARFRLADEGWQQTFADADEAVPFLHVDLTAVEDSEVSAAIEQAATRLQSGLNLASGPLLRVALFDLGAERSARLLIVIHHLAVDGVSWRILLDDLQLAYRQLGAGEPVRFLNKTTSYKHWSERLAQYARTEKVLEEADSWLAVSASGSLARVPVDFAGEMKNDVGSAQSVAVSLTVEETVALLQEVPSVYHTQINDILLAALLQVLTGWTGASEVLVEMEGHGREDIFDDVDLSRTVGWFTTIFPVRLEMPEASGAGEMIKAVKAQLQSIPQRGIGYGLLRYLNDEALGDAAFARLPQAEISFNYLGQFDQVLHESSPFAYAAEAIGATISPRAARLYLLEVNGMVAGGRLRLNWTYSEKIHLRETIERLAEDYLAALRALIQHCLSPEAGDYTTADFTPFDWDQEDLTSIEAAISNSSRKQRSGAGS
jgi:amino acid adenylation domain-containing protein/non-ribosomal peptide synthase protein (TIGR01720 family)